MIPSKKELTLSLQTVALFFTKILKEAYYPKELPKT